VHRHAGHQINIVNETDINNDGKNEQTHKQTKRMTKEESNKEIINKHAKNKEQKQGRNEGQ
jgi:hypothetical protein